MRVVGRKLTSLRLCREVGQVVGVPRGTQLVHAGTYGRRAVKMSDFSYELYYRQHRLARLPWWVHGRGQDGSMTTGTDRRDWKPSPSDCHCY